MVVPLFCLQQSTRHTFHCFWNSVQDANLRRLGPEEARPFVAQKLLASACISFFHGGCPRETLRDCNFPSIHKRNQELKCNLWILLLSVCKIILWWNFNLPVEPSFLNLPIKIGLPAWAFCCSLTSYDRNQKHCSFLSFLFLTILFHVSLVGGPTTKQPILKNGRLVIPEYCLCPEKLPKVQKIRLYLLGIYQFKLIDLRVKNEQLDLLFKTL